MKLSYSISGVSFDHQGVVCNKLCFGYQYYTKDCSLSRCKGANMTRGCDVIVATKVELEIMEIAAREIWSEM